MQKTRGGDFWSMMPANIMAAILIGVGIGFLLGLVWVAAMVILKIF